MRDTFWRIVRVPIADQHSNEDKSNHDQARYQIQLDHGMGRSAYVCQKLECLQIAQKKNRLGRSLRTHIPPEMFEILKSRL